MVDETIVTTLGDAEMTGMGKEEEEEMERGEVEVEMEEEEVGMEEEEMGMEERREEQSEELGAKS